METIKNYLLISIILALSSCATDKLSRQQVLNKNTFINQLNHELQKSASNDINLLSPKKYNEAEKKLKEAIKYAQKDKDIDKGSKIASEGLSILNLAKKDANKSREIFEEILSLRSQAQDAKAAKFFKEEYDEAEKKLKEAAKYVEDGKLDEAREERPDLIQRYSELEIKSLKKGTLKEAKEALKLAEDKGAKKYAPKSYKLAKKEIDLASNILEADKDQGKNAGEHAEKAKFFAEKAAEIAILSKSFERRNYSRENMILWYHDQLKEIFSNMRKNIPFNLSNLDLVKDLKATIDSLLMARDNLKEISNRKTKQINELETTIQSMVSQGEWEKRQTKKQKDKFQEVQNLFNDDEAQVYKEQDRIILKVHGFYFPIEKADIKVRNFTLLDKIIEAINKFPNSNIYVTGHTDSTGNNAFNLKLSKERARNISTFLNKIGGISKNRLAYDGYGEQKPVESNNTKKGRSLNRRIEVTIESL